MNISIERLENPRTSEYSYRIRMGNFYQDASKEEVRLLAETATEAVKAPPVVRWFVDYGKVVRPSYEQFGGEYVARGESHIYARSKEDAQKRYDMLIAQLYKSAKDCEERSVD